MRLIAKIRSLLRNLFLSHRVEADLDHEVRSHLAMLTEENIRAGMPPSEAQRAARIELGGVEQVKEQMREERIGNWLRSVLSDCRFGVRQLRKNPGFTAVAILTLALGIGANSAFFSIVNAVMLRPLPYVDSERLVSLRSKTGMFPDMSLNLTWPVFQKIRKHASSFEQSAVYWDQSRAFTGGGEPLLLETTTVSDQFFEQLGARPQLGRLLGDADQRETNGKVVVLSDVLWRTRFGSDAQILGQTIRLDQQPYTVVGIAAKDFAFPEKTEAWTPLAVEPATRENPTFFAFAFIGKLKSGVAMSQLNLELKPISAQMVTEYPKLKDGYELVATKLKDDRVSDSRLAFFLLLGAATFVLLIACTNLASMLLSRTSARQQEIAVRSALGASRARIFRQMLVESCLLGISGGAAGVGLAALVVQIFHAVAPADTPRLAEIHPDWAMAAFAGASALLTGIFFGVAPARHAARAAIHTTLKEGAGARSVGIGTRQSKIGKTLVVSEVSLAFVLLVGAGLMLQTFERLLTQNPGFRTDNVLTFDLYRPALESDANRKKDAAAQVQQTKNIVQQVQGLPGVEGVAASNYALLDGTISVHGGLRVEGSSTISPDAGFAVTARYVSPAYFRTLGLALLRGRGFADTDVLGTAPVAIINERMAKKFWGTLDVLGQRFNTSTDEKGIEEWSEVVGVVTSTRDVIVKEEPDAEYYMPLYQGGMSGSVLLVRTASNPETLAGTITKQIWSVYPDLPVSHVMTLRATIEKSAGNEKLHATLLTIFAGIGLLMALAGTYGVVAYAAERRTQEIGVRIALGATRHHVLLLVCRHAFFPVLVGIAVGVPVALAAQRAIASELYGVKATDPLTFTAAALLMILVAGIACWIPARRATHVDPMIVLRYE